MSEEVVGAIRFPVPSWRVVGEVRLENLEKELRKRSRDYDCAFATQQGEIYTLFFRARWLEREYSHAQEIPQR